MPDHDSAPDDLLARLSERVAAGMGLHFPPERRSDLERGVRAAAAELGFEDATACLRWLVSPPQLSPDQIEVLAGHLTIGETYFWRDANIYTALESHILPPLIEERRAGGRRQLRLWSAGCCTGEEPYSLAILLHRLLPDAAEWNLRVLGTDINPRFLHRAEEAVYGEWSFRDAPPWLKERYFRQTGEGRWAVLPEIKKRVAFSCLNLAEDAYPSLGNNTNAMDVIFCRNVLMYLSPEHSKKAIAGFYRALVEGGCLSVSPTEASHLFRSAFVASPFPGATLYRKDSQPPPAPDPPVPPRQILRPAPPRIAPPPTVKAPPPPPRDPYGAALALYEQGRYEEAAETLGPEPTSGKARSLLARACANQGRLAEARAWCDRALAVEKLNPGGHYLRATILQEMGDMDEAVRSLRRSLFLDHDFVPAHFALGNITRQQGKVRESARHFANALALLGRYGPEEILPESEGITAGRLSEIIATLMESEGGE